jgi:hypothetical protein
MKLLTTGFVRVDTLRSWPRAALLFPRYNEAQYRELNDFHSRHGDDSVLPIVINAQHQIIDGYNRVDAAKLSGAVNIMAHTYEYANEGEQEIHAIVLNAKRRHLDEAVKARAALRLAELYRPTEEEKKNLRSHPGKAGRKKKSNPQQCEFDNDRTITSGAVTEIEDAAAECWEICVKCRHPKIDHHGKDGKLTGVCTAKLPSGYECFCCEFRGPGDTIPVAPLPVQEKPGKKKRAESATEKAAREVGVAPKTMKAVAKVDATGDQGLINAMNSRLVGIDKAAKIADLPPEQREVALKVVRGELQKGIDGMQAVADGLRKENADVGIGACIEAGMILDKGMAKLPLPKLEPGHLDTLLKALEALGNKVRGYALQITQFQDRHDGKTIDVKAAEVTPDEQVGADPTWRTYPAKQRGKGSVCLCGHHNAAHQGPNGHCELCECELFEIETH